MERCEVEVERWGHADPCGLPAEWSVQVEINNGVPSRRIMRCEEHVLATVQFHLEIDTTTGVIITAVVR